MVFLLSATLSVCGCATQQSLLAPGQDPDRLVEAIAARGQTPCAEEAPPGRRPLLGDCVQVGGKVVATIGVLAVCALYGIAGFDPSEKPAAATDKPIRPEDDSVWECLERIWSKG
jgi:hypothetical protein